MGGAGYNQSKGGIPTGGGYQPPAAASYGGQQSQFSAPVTGGMKGSAAKPAGPTEPPTFGSVQAQARPGPTQAPAPAKPAQAPAAAKPAIQGGGGQDRGAGDAFANFKGPAQTQTQVPARPAGDRIAPGATAPIFGGQERIPEPQPQPYRGGVGQQMNDMLMEQSRGNLNIYSPNAPTAHGYSWGQSQAAGK